jgi:succinate dehydrogenase/fumarate reductase flavoprotein subunit
MTDDIRRYAYDVVVVIGAGGSGLRAAIEARLNGRLGELLGP